jgi:hypothetical protein
MAARPWPTPLSNAFFSDFNWESIHQEIIRNVKTKTGYTIDKQNDADLQALMRKVYTDMVSNEYDNVREQVSGMNAKVISEAEKFVLTGVLQQIVYLQDISTNPVPFAAPINTSTYGNKLPINNRYGINPQ